MTRLLLCTDLDRTLIPNGNQPESPGAKARFGRLVDRKEVTLAFVTGRHRAIIEQAIRVFSLPRPDFAIADVGTTIYHIDDAGWTLSTEWDEQIAADWHGLTHDDLSGMLSVFPALRLQEQEKQNRHKLSYYAALDTDARALIAEVDARLKQAARHPFPDATARLHPRQYDVRRRQRQRPGRADQ